MNNQFSNRFKRAILSKRFANTLVSSLTPASDSTDALQAFRESFATAFNVAREINAEARRLGWRQPRRVTLRTLATFSKENDFMFVGISLFVPSGQEYPVDAGVVRDAFARVLGKFQQRLVQFQLPAGAHPDARAFRGAWGGLKVVAFHQPIGHCYSEHVLSAEIPVDRFALPNLLRGAMRNAHGKIEVVSPRDVRTLLHSNPTPDEVSGVLVRAQRNVRRVR